MVHLETLRRRLLGVIEVVDAGAEPGLHSLQGSHVQHKALDRALDDKPHEQHTIIQFCVNASCVCALTSPGWRAGLVTQRPADASADM